MKRFTVKCVDMIFGATYDVKYSWDEGMGVLSRACPLPDPEVGVCSTLEDARRLVSEACLRMSLEPVENERR